jgi:sterol 14-demethylase
MAEAPEIFRVDEKGRLTLLAAEPPMELLGKAKAAEKFCPAQAIKIAGKDCQRGALSP